MKKLSAFFKSLTAYDITFAAAALTLFILAVMLPPVRSIADQGDFERVMRPCGLDFPAGTYSFYGYAERFYNMSFTKTDALLYIPRLLFIVPSTAFIFPVSLAKLICAPFGAFDVRVLGFIMFVWYAAVCTMILRRVTLKSRILKWLFYALFLFVFFNGVSLTIFNSLYGQSVMLASLATLALAALMLFENVQKARRGQIVFFTVASCLLLGSKLQCVVFVPFMAAALIYAGAGCGFKKTAAVCAVFVLWYGAGGYAVNGGGLNTDTQYNSVFYGILKDSPDPAADLRALGIDEAMAVDAGKHAYLAPSEYAYPPRTEKTTELFHSKMSNSKLIKFYITHPARLIAAMETTAKSAFTNKINLGTFEKSCGFAEGESSYRLELWESARERLPRTLLFIIPLWCAFLAVGVVALRRKNRYALPFLALLLMGALQFPMPYMGNGAADVSKQLFLFNITADAGIAASVLLLFGKLDGLFKK